MSLSLLEFAVAIVFPGVGAADIVAAAIKHEVHVIDKEEYAPQKDYAAYHATYEPYVNGSRIMLLFVFTGGFSVLADNPQNLEKAMERIRMMG
jgi:hypothetical protein